MCQIGHGQVKYMKRVINNGRLIRLVSILWHLFPKGMTEESWICDMINGRHIGIFQDINNVTYIKTDGTT